MPHIYLTDRQPISIAKGLTTQGQRMAEQTRQAKATPPMTAWVLIEGLASARVAKSATPLTRQQAIAHVIQERPDLFARYKREGYATAVAPVAAPVVKRHGVAWDGIEAHAQVLILKSQAPMTKQAAITAAILAHPDLCAQYNAERKRR